ncbi:hypothetical protein [Devosia sp. 2618]|uniref:hypothetical protein n=1 Tax=Devosia sp. 2618 TaxID=3156454 RepID=UPI003395FE44
MRTFLIVIFALFAAPAFAQEWQHYSNARFGYEVDIPPGFDGSGESENGDGQSFYNPDGAKGLLVWGGNLLGSFEQEVMDRQGYAQSENGVAITYQATTPRWASFSGTGGGQIIYQRMILLCGGTSYAAFRAQYAVRDVAKMDPVIARLVQSLEGNC